MWRTKSKKTCEALCAQAERYRAFVQTAGEGIYRLEIEPPLPTHLPVDEQIAWLYRHAVLAECNDFYARMYGYERAEEVIGQGIELTLPRSAANLVMLRDWMRSGYVIRDVESRGTDKDGIPRIHLSNAIGVVKNDHVVRVWGTERDITPLKQAQEARQRAEAAMLEEREAAALRRSTLLGAVAAVSATLANHLALSQGLASAARILGEATGVDRVNVIRYDHLEGSGFLSADWCREGIVSVKSIDPGPYPFIDYEEVWRPLMAGAVYSSPIWQKSGANADLNRTAATQTDVMVPIQVGDRFWGALNLDDCTGERTWDEGEIEVLRSAAHAVAAALSRDALEREKTEAVAREREHAAQERAVHLAKANDALRRAVERLAGASNTDALLDALLLEAVTVTGAAAGAILDRVGDVTHSTTFSMRSLTHDGTIIRPFDAFATQDSLREATARDAKGVMRRTVAGEVFSFPAEDMEAWFPEAAAYHRGRGHRVVWHFPFWVNGHVTGFLGLAFCEQSEVQTMLIEVIQALTYQASLGLEMLRLAEKARDAVIAREQERAAQERAAELAKANDVLQRVVARLASQEDVPLFLNAVLQEAAHSSGARTAAIFRYDAQAHTLSMTECVCDSQVVVLAHDPRFDIWREPVRDNINEAWHHLLSRGVLWFEADSPEHWPMAVPWHQMMGHKTVVVLLLRVGESVLGFLELCFTTHVQSDEVRIEFCSTLAQQAAFAIQFMRLTDEARCKAQESAVLDERTRMAREIHDTLAQSFTGVTTHLEAARALVPFDSKAQFHIAQARELAREGLQEARRSVRALRPSALEGSDLCRALGALLRDLTQDTPVRGHLHIKGEPRPLGSEVETQLLRIGQEALTNALRHAQPRNVEVGVTFVPDEFALRVQDDGRGFDLDAMFSGDTEPCGFGLVGMRERAARLGGRLTLRSQLGEGTQVRVSVPCLAITNGETEP